MSNFAVVAFYTAGSPYALEAAKLGASAKRVGVDAIIVEAPNLGSWQANVQFKAKFIRAMLDDKRVAGRPVAYVDADAEFVAYPELFDRLTEFGADLSVGFLDHSKFGRRRIAWRELIASTLWFANNDEARRILSLWIKENELLPEIWDQKNLQAVIDRQGGVVQMDSIWGTQIRMVELPETYFKIFDTMASVENPVIVQHQRSRIYRRRGGKIMRFGLDAI